MTKADIINEVAIATGMPKKEVGIVVEAFMEEVKKCLIEKKDNVYLRGFGSFNIKHRAAKTARNISKNTTITIPAHDLPSFKPSKSFIEEMQNAPSLSLCSANGCSNHRWRRQNREEGLAGFRF